MGKIRLGTIRGVTHNGDIFRLNRVTWWLVRSLSDDTVQDNAWEAMLGGLWGNPWWRFWDLTGFKLEMHLKACDWLHGWDQERQAEGPHSAEGGCVHPGGWWAGWLFPVVWEEKPELLLLINFKSCLMMPQTSLRTPAFPIFQLVPEGPENILQNLTQLSWRVKHLLLKQGF